MQAQHHIDIHAPIGIVWATLTGVDAWPRWQKGVTKAALSGPLGEGATFDWTSGGMGIRSRIVALSAPTTIEWTGEALGTRARHSWALEAHGNRTTVRTSETLEGWMVSLLGVFDRGFLDKALVKVLAELKAEAERAASIVRP